LRVIKTDTLSYETFYESLQYLAQADSQRSEVKLLKPEVILNSGNMLEKYAHLFQNLLAFTNYLNDKNRIGDVLKALKSALKHQLTLKETTLFLFNDNPNKLTPLDPFADEKITHFVNYALKEGMLEKIFKKNVMTFILNNKSSESGSNLNYIFVPITEGDKRRGILLIQTPVNTFAEGTLEYGSVKIILEIAIQRINSLLKNNELKEVYHDLQVYQSKLQNDYKLSAIGELTSGIVEDIMNPLQVILTYADMIQSEQNHSDNGIVENIKSQIKKIEVIIGRLVKFASVNNEKAKIAPCSLNDTITEFYNVVNSSFKTKKYECVLDFENNIPSIAANKDLLNQLLINVFGILSPTSSSGGGILVQTKQMQDNVAVKIFTTDCVNAFLNGKLTPEEELSVRMINNIMKKFDGNVLYEANETSGSSITLLFPLKRKMSL
jgi:K+-sensing histidine kinase KdpD